MTASCKERGYQLVGREQRKDLKKFKIKKIWKQGKKVAGWAGGGVGGCKRSGKKERVLLCLCLISCYVAACIKFKKCTYAMLPQTRGRKGFSLFAGKRIVIRE